MPLYNPYYDTVLQASQLGDITELYLTTEENSADAAYTKVKEIKVGRSGSYRIRFDLACAAAAGTAYGRIYKNGVAIGTERSKVADVNYTTYTEDFTGIVLGDLIQLYAKSAGVNYKTRNMEVCTATPIPSGIIMY